jgi:predicted CopG family antitoxin
MHNEHEMPNKSDHKAGAERGSERPGREQMQTTAVHLTRDMWELLRKVAFHRAQISGGRASVSEVVRRLIEGSRRDLEKEINP